MGKNSKSPRPQGQIKKFIGPYQITWTFVDTTENVMELEEDVSIAGEEKTYLSYFLIPPGSDGTDINEPLRARTRDILLERIAYWQNKQ